MHQHGIIHRDVKSANIFINIPGRDNAKPDDVIEDDDLKRAEFKIADLNIAVKTLPGQMRTTMNGTPFFCSPEMLNHRQYNYNHDIYSLGVTLYHLTSFSLPFLGDTIPEILRN